MQILRVILFEAKWQPDKCPVHFYSTRQPECGNQPELQSVNLKLPKRQNSTQTRRLNSVPPLSSHAFAELLAGIRLSMCVNKGYPVNTNATGDYFKAGH